MSGRNKVASKNTFIYYRQKGYTSPPDCAPPPGRSDVPMPGGLPNPPMPPGTRLSFGSPLAPASSGLSYAFG